MSDGNMALQVSPIVTSTESDLMSLKAFFERVANAIVQASEMGKTVEALSAQVADLVATTERYNAQIGELTTQLAEMRGQCDEYIMSRDYWQGEAKLYEDKWLGSQVSLAAEIDAHTATRQAMQTEIDDLKAKLSASQSEATDHFLSLCEASGRAAAAEAKLSETLGHISAMSALLAPPPAPAEPPTLAPVHTPEPDGQAPADYPITAYSRF